MTRIKPEITILNLGLSVKVTTDALVPLITLDDAKGFCRIDLSDTSEDALITALINSATSQAQKFTNLSFITQTLTAEWDSTGDIIPLPHGPIQSIVEVNKIAYDGTAQVLDPTAYALKNNKLIASPTSGLRVEYIAGYGDVSADVPGDIITAVQKMVLDQYDHRENQIVGDSVDMMNNTSAKILSQFIEYESF